MPEELPEKQQESTEDLIKKCDGWFEESRSFWNDRRERWRKNERLYENEVEVPGPRGATKLKFNLALSVVETEKPIIADYLPTFDIKAAVSDGVAFADEMQHRKTQIERQANLRQHIIEAIHDALVLSNGLVRIDPKYKRLVRDANGRGRNDADFDEDSAQIVEEYDGIEITAVDPYTWFPAPDATGMDIRKNARYHIFATPMHVDEIKRLYRVNVKPEGFLDEYGVFKERGGSEDKNTHALVKECYFMDEDEVMHPYGRVIVWANDELISDDPLWADASSDDDEPKRIPYFMISNYRSPHTLMGMGEPELIKTQILALNETMSSLAEVIKKSGNPIRKIARTLYNQMNKKIRGVAGEDVVVNHPNDITWDVPPNVPVHTFEFIKILLDLTDVVTGVHDVTQGRKPTGVTAASAIAALQETAIARVRHKISTEITRFVLEIGRFIVFILQEYDSEAMSIREDSDTGETQFHEYDPTSLRDASGLKENEEGFDESSAKSMKDVRFDIDVVPGVRIPAGRVATEEMAREKFAAGIYGIEEYAENSTERDKRKLIENFYSRQGLEAMKERQETLRNVFPEFDQMVDEAVSDPDKFIDDQFAGTRMVELLVAYPEFLTEEKFRELPPEVVDGVLAAFAERLTSEEAEHPQIEEARAEALARQ